MSQLEQIKKELQDDLQQIKAEIKLAETEHRRAYLFGQETQLMTILVMLKRLEDK